METFQFYLYVSYSSRKEAVGLDLFEALKSYCLKHGLLNFDLHVRMAIEGKNPRRWDADFVRDELERFKLKEVQRIWVCGPPGMNQEFDMVLTEMKQN